MITGEKIKKVTDEVAEELGYEFERDFKTEEEINLGRNGFLYKGHSDTENVNYCDRFHVTFTNYPSDINHIESRDIKSVGIKADVEKHDGRVVRIFERKLKEVYSIDGLKGGDYPDFRPGEHLGKPTISVYLRHIEEDADPVDVLRRAIRATVFAAQDIGRATDAYTYGVEQFVPEPREL
jgi:hypothetical protein